MTELDQTVHTLALARVERAAGSRGPLPDAMGSDRVPVRDLDAAYERAFGACGGSVIDGAGWVERVERTEPSRGRSSTSRQLSLCDEGVVCREQ